MPINPNTAQAHAGLKATYPATRIGVTASSSVAADSSVTLPATESIAFQVELDADFKVEIPLDTLVPVITGGAGQPQMVELQITAAGGITSNGNLAVTIAGAHVTPGTYQVPVTTALTTASAIVTAIANDSGVAAAMGDYFLSSDGSKVACEDSLNRANDPTLSIAVAVGHGVSAASSELIQSGGAPAKCYSLPGTTYAGENPEGGSIAAPTTYYAVEVLPVGLGVAISAGNLQDTLVGGEVFHKHAAGGLLYGFEPAETLTLESVGGPVSVLVILQFSTD